MDRAAWEPAGRLLSDAFPGTRMDWLGGGVWTLPGEDAPRQPVEYRGRRLPNHQEFTVKTRGDWDSFHLGLEFKFDDDPAPKTDLERFGNGGVYIFGLYEIQLVDTSRFLAPGPLPDDAVGRGIVKVALHGDTMQAPANKVLCGSIYGGAASKDGDPLRGATADRLGRPCNFCRPSGQWNRLDVYFTPARFQRARKTHLATIALEINGQRVYFDGHDRFGIPHPTGSQGRKPERARGPIVLQDHAGKVSFRAIQINPSWRPRGDFAVAATREADRAVVAMAR